MENLPNKPFVFNYNAKDYNIETYTIQKTNGQTLDRDLVYTGDGKSDITKSGDYITTVQTTSPDIDFNTSGANPLNLTASNNNLTVVFKAKYVYLGNNQRIRGDLVGNYDGSHLNWLVRIGSREGYSTSTVKISFTYNNSTVTFDTGISYTSGDTVIGAVVVNNGSYVIKNIETGESTVAKSIPNNGGYGSGSTKFFSSFNGDIYWLYCSREVLTDAEIQQVIDFNDSSFGPSSTGGTIGASGGTLTTDLEAETGWTVTTKPTWVMVSPSSGESGTTSVSFTIKKNNFSFRTGTVVFTDDEGNTAEYTIEQGGTDGLVPFEKMYRNERRIN